MQRLFSTFADGWPGAGLLLLRLVAGVPLLYFAIVHRTTNTDLVSFARLLAAAGAFFLIIGLWTPIAGAVIALVEWWMTFSHVGNPLIAFLLAALAAGLAMIGPGAWSFDARLFGRKQIETSSRR